MWRFLNPCFTKRTKIENSNFRLLSLNQIKSCWMRCRALHYMQNVFVFKCQRIPIYVYVLKLNAAIAASLSCSVTSTYRCNAAKVLCPEMV